MAYEPTIGDAPVILSGIGGLNLSMDQSDIAQEELSIGYNIWYDSSSGVLSTRGGISCETSTPAPAPIDLMYSFIRKDNDGYLVGISNSKLYVFNTATTEWDHVSDLSSDNPSLRAFNGNLYIADGDVAGILKWDGTAEPARLAESPQATALHVAGNRLIANSIADTELDAVYMSGTESDDFNTDTGGGIIIRAGYGDGQRVNCFNSISDTLIVSKVAYLDGKASKKHFYGINMAGESTAWTADYVSKNNAAVGPHAMAGMGQDLFYLDTQGLESLEPTQEYGDIATDPVVGGKINSFLGTYIRNAGVYPKISVVSNLASLVIIVDNQIFLRSNLTGGFTQVEFGTKINHIINHGDDVYLAGDSGHLYLLISSGSDEISPGEFTYYNSAIRYKMMTGNGELLLTKSFFDIKYITSGTYKIYGAAGDRSTTTVLKIVDFVTPTGSEYLYDANYELANANFDLGSEGTSPRLPCRAKYRGNGIAVQINTSNGGRISVGKVTMMLANVGK